jgi:2,3-bisphosphoglycerate-independent phosphoglycerate mutase
MKHVKAILVVGDGMGDRPLKELNGKTPLEVAKKPSLNKLAEDGVCGIIDMIAPGIPPGSDVAHLALLGYDAQRVYSGRGAFEAIGFGVKILPGDVAFRCNFATVDDKFTVIDRRAGRIATVDAARLAEEFKEITLPGQRNLQIMFKNTIQHRAILVLRGKNLSTKVSGSDPFKAGKKVLEARPLENTAAAKRTAQIINKLTHYFHEILKKHPLNIEREMAGLFPANIILCRGAGKLPDLVPLTLRYNISAVAISAMPLVKGVCKAAGMEILEVSGATGTYDTNVLAKAKATINALRVHDFVFVHVKGTDVASHDSRVDEKIRMIEKIDQLVGYVIRNVDLNKTYITVTADHTTSSRTKEHEGDPVPVVIHGPEVRTDDVKEFSEKSCASGGLGRIKGKDLMPIIMNLLGKTKKFGA